MAFCHQLNRPLKGYIKFNEGSHCQATQAPSPHIFSLASSVFLAGYVLKIHFCVVVSLTRHFGACQFNESMLDGDNTACVDCGVASPMSYQCVCAAS